MSDEIEKISLPEAKLLFETKNSIPDADVSTNISNNEDLSTSRLQENTLKSYIQQWDSYFTNYDNDVGLLNHLKSKAFHSSLRNCLFRSICWRLFLGCLPPVVSQWEQSLKQSRESYACIKAKHCTNPHDDSKEEDLELENPLSQDDDSRWSQFFKNEELKVMINRDVRRTCPELTFFHSDDIRGVLENVLFCYAREHESLSYRQGMHELLAPLIFVLQSDLQGAAHNKEIGELPSIICNVLDSTYLEHDAYSMFSQVMDSTNPWYSVGASRSTDDITEDFKKLTIPTAPFQNIDSASPGTTLAITTKLNRIHNTLLSHYDVELYHHLNRHEIIPQVYGLRWVRLLFGREFDLQDLLVLWDALFADSKSLDLVDYIFVAMMYNIRQNLLASDYCGCMQMLMQYPAIEDIFDLVHLAMHYRDPKNYEKPASMRRKPSNSGMSSSQFSLGISRKKKIIPASVNNFFSDLSTSIKKIRTSPPRERRSLGDSSLHPGDASIQFAKSKPINSSEMIAGEKASLPQSKLERLRSMSGLDSMKLIRSEDEIRENEIEIFKQKLADLQDKCVYCSDKIDASIRTLQPYLMKDYRLRYNNENEPPPSPENGDSNTLFVCKNEEQLVALADLKKVRDMLRGVLGFVEKNPRSQSTNQAVCVSDARSIPDSWTLVERPNLL